MQQDNGKYCEACGNIIHLKADTCPNCGALQPRISLNTKKQQIGVMYILKKYIAANKLMSGVATYFIVSILLKIVFSVNILIPCLWKTLFHVECPGCGLTTAFTKLVMLDFAGAYTANPLIYIVLPAGVFYIYKDFIKFKVKLKN